MNASPPAAPAGRRRSLRRPLDLRRDGSRVAAFLGVVLALDVVLWFGLVRPQRRAVATLRAEGAKAEEIAKRQEKAFADLKALHDRVTGAQRDIDKFYGEMLATKEDRLVPFQRALVQVGQEFNVAPERVAVSYSELAQEGIDALAFSFPLTGGYENLRRFLSRLESLDQFLIVREVGLTGGKEGGQALQLTVAVETYFNAPELRDAAEKAGRGGTKARPPLRRVIGPRRTAGR